MVCSRLIRIKPKPAGCIPGLLGLKQNIQGVSQVTGLNLNLQGVSQATGLNLNLQGVSQITSDKTNPSGCIPDY